MAGAGFKTFNTGDVLTASDVNTYLMQQTVMVFADSSARTTALGANVAEGMLSYLKDTDVVEVYNGSAWVSSDDPNAIQNTIVDAKGDLISATAADTPARLAVGTNGQVLTADSSTATGLKWADSAAGGMTLISTTTLSGATTTISSIPSGYNYLYILGYGMTNATATGAFSIKINGSNGDQYMAGWAGSVAAAATEYHSAAAFVTNSTQKNPANTIAANQFVMQIYDYAGSQTVKSFDLNFNFDFSGGVSNYSIRGCYYGASAITSLVFANAGGNFNGGTIKLYGVK